MSITYMKMSENNLYVQYAECDTKVYIYSINTEYIYIVYRFKFISDKINISFIKFNTVF